ncbi:MAG: transcriptional repressor NrdR [Oscillospiraceae bacterium]|nr:transcriptional repressor NrdR [Oscillospiraceae bacterium]
MKCPFCGELDSKVVESRPAEDGSRIRRRRECLRCKERFTTYETVETVPLIVIKKDGSRESFDRQKLLNSLLKACGKRPVAYEELERTVDSIEKRLSNSLEKEVQSIRIGELAMDELRKIDEVAYIRFASVYRQFSDIDTFMQELSELMRRRTEGRIVQE